MKYALGNMLNGAGGLNADQLALDLQFAADKTLTARKGPTPILTRGSTGTFVGSNGLIQTAAVDAARFDHDPVTFACRGLLIEEGRTNLYNNSEDFSQASWTKTRLSIQTNATTSPDGTTTADKLIEDTSASNTHTIGSTVTPPATPHTLSVFAKKGERNFIVLRLGGQNDFFNLNTGVALTNANSPTITNYGNGWYRCTVTSSLGTQGSFQMSADGITSSYTGDGTSGIFIWGAQLEAGSFATSYIPTTTSALARSADVCSITGANFTSFYNQPEGTLFADARVETAARSANGFFTSLYNASSNEFSLRIFSNEVQVTVRDGGAAKDFNIGGVATNMKVAAAYSSLNNVASLNGLAVVTGTASNLPAMIGLSVGSRFAASTFANGHIAAIRYYKKRLANAKLVTLTV